MGYDASENHREQQAEAVAKFTDELRRLRVKAGNPSFRRLAGLSGTISHTTLHEAAAGHRMPSWETTREFVRACGGDEAEWRARWEHAVDAVPARPAPTSPPAVRPARRRFLVAGGGVLGTAPPRPGVCMVSWKMVDDQGRLFLPSSRPVYFLVRVVR